MHTKFLTMNNGRQSSPLHYGIAVLSVAIATPLSLLLQRLGYPSFFALFFVAVVTSAWIGGLGPAIVATVLSALTTAVYLLPRPNSYSVTHPSLSQLILFVLICLYFCWLVAKQRRSEAARRGSEAHFRSLFERNLAGVFLSNTDGVVLACNESFAEILGYDSREDVLARPASDFYFDTEDRESYLAQLRKDGSVTNFEVRLRSKDDTPVWIIENVSLIEDDVGARNVLQGTMIDITERKRAEMKLRESEKQLRDAQRIARIGSWHWDISNDQTTWSEELFNIFGVKPEEFSPTYEGVSALICPDDRAAVEATVQAALIDLKPHNYDYSIVRPDGTVRLIHAESEVVCDERGRPAALAGTAQDITERKHAEESLHEAERKYHDIFEHAVEGVFRTTPDGRFIEANPALANMLGYDSPADLLRDESDLARQVYVEPQRREEFTKLMDEHGMVRSFEFKVSRKDGSKIWISDHVRAVHDDNGEVIFYEGTAEDITERKRAQEALRQSEERYRELFENARDAIYVQDMDGTYISVNRAAEGLSGYPRAEIIGRNYSEFVAPEYLQLIQERLNEKKAGHVHSAYELEISRKDGRRVNIEVHSRLIYENGIAVGVQGMARDISDRKRAEKALRAFPRRLISAQEAERRRVALELHDEIGQALTAVNINLQNMQKLADGLPFAAHFDGSLSIIDRALTQVRDLALDLRPALLDDLGLVAAIRWYVDRETKRAGLTLNLNIELNETRLAPEIETACFRITQEALTNIVRHARASHVSVELELRHSVLSLIISDDGIGFDVGEIKRRSAANTSLGLLGMKERTLAVRGKFEVESSTEKGTKVHVHIPFLPNPTSNEED